MSTEYQLCPMCRGQGIVSKPPWVAGDQETWIASGTQSYECRLCHGDGKIRRPIHVETHGYLLNKDAEEKGEG